MAWVKGVADGFVGQRDGFIRPKRPSMIDSSVDVVLGIGIVVFATTNIDDVFILPVLCRSAAEKLARL